MILPTRRWLIGAAWLSLVALVGLWNPAVTSLLLVCDFIWLLVFLIDVLRISGVDLAEFPVTRNAPPAFSVGRPMPVQYIWRNPASRPSVLVVRELAASQFADGASMPRSIKLPADGSVRETLEFNPLRRGKTVAGTLLIRLRGPWGLACRQGRRTLPWKVTVYPSVKRAVLHALPAAAARRRDAGQRNVRRLGEGRVFESLREWVPGDERRTIDWKATARRGKPMARQYEAERRQDVMLLIDAGRMLTAETTGRPRLEYAIDAALELAYAAALQDDNVGAMIFGDEIQSLVPPTRGRRAIRLVLDALAGAEGRLVESNYPVAFARLAAQQHKRSLTVLFSDVIDRTASDAMLARIGGLRPRHLPLLVVLRDPALECLASARPATTNAAFDRAAAEELLEAREAALAELRRRGVVVIDVLPDGAAQAVVRQYQQLKRAGVL